MWSIAAVQGALVSASEDGTLRLWSVATNECIAVRAAGRGPVHSVAALTGDVFVAGFADGHVVLYRIDHARGAFEALDVVRAHEGEVYRVARIDDQAFASRGYDGVARVWSLAHGLGHAETDGQYNFGT